MIFFFTDQNSDEALGNSVVPQNRLVKSGQSFQAGGQGVEETSISNVNQKLKTATDGQLQYFPQMQKLNQLTDRKAESYEQQQQQQKSLSQQGQFGQLDQAYSEQQSQHSSAEYSQVGETQQSLSGLRQQNQFGQAQQLQNNIDQQNQVDLGQQSQYPLVQQNLIGQKEVSHNLGQQNQFGQGQQNQLGVGQQNQLGVGQQNQLGLGQQNQLGLGQQNQLGLGQQNQLGLGQQNQFGLGQQSLPSQSVQNQFDPRKEFQYDTRQQSLASLIQPNQQPKLEDQYKDLREKEIASEQPPHRSSDQVMSDERGNIPQYYKEQTQEPVVSEDQDMVDYGKQALHNQVQSAEGVNPTLLQESYPSVEQSRTVKLELGEVYEGEEDEETDKEEDQMELDPEERALAAEEKGTQDVSSLYDQNPNEDQENEDGWYDDPNSYDEDDKSYMYGNEKREEGVDEADDNVQVSENGGEHV
ncbi:A-kinase anchor protein 5 [Elysia marginata]|uniref:A-kinase anchor protein 5 n=1 Tax=Elysia marginata TaxID=1093978 RepID=A0AAV4G4Q1_9GAST|nr:A-kinase anchor protein 5 [Elysia marginata]